MAKAIFESVQAQQLIELIEESSIITTPGIDASVASPLCIGTGNATAINIGHTGLSVYSYGSSLFIGSILDTVTNNPLILGGNATIVMPKNNAIMFGASNYRWQNGYFINTHSNWFNTSKGEQLKINTDAITPISGLHHVDGIGGGSINTINLTNIPQDSSVELILIADNGAITFGKKQGNIKSSGSIPKDSARKFIWDGTFWYLVGQ